MKLLEWSVFEVISKNDLQGVMFRGRLRKFALENKINLFVENDEKDKNCVRFAILIDEIDSFSKTGIQEFIQIQIDPDAQIQLLGKFRNPVLSKLKVNDENRYTI